MPLDLGSRRVFGIRLPILIYITFFVVVGVLLLIGFLMGPGPNAGDVLLEDDFSVPSARWPAGATEGGFTSFDSGVYRIGVDPDGSLSALTYLDVEATDVAVSVDVVRVPSDGAVLLGLACRAGAGDRFDELVISPAGHWAILHRPDRRVLGQGSFDVSLLRAVTVRLEATCLGGGAEGEPVRLALSVNGTVVGRAREAGGAGAPLGVGMVVENGTGEAADVRFDDFRVTAA